ncbi:protein PHYTOCHROME KINASE SUBSTRATE 4-like [Salvia miltiorrhiza]|uniref:protein PHYTOCHROME KINASE SUBSTRATE 4-like n=1 Tax=Salvia miltiorrhiza TaxID=226208 RepID=UPI0025AB849B|nr:protein PHYTOCHROME KINASE SUBSTRATE 4-like [Salvia miltiorrhiza]
MDPASMVKSFKYSSTQQQQPMFGVLEAPLHYRSSSSPHNNATSFQDASFSSYLKSNDHKSQQKILAAVDDTEISIFDAQKYFSENSDPKEMIKKQPMPHDTLSSVPRLSSVSSTDGYGGRNFRTRSFHATPTASSEASWNSQTGLLQNPPGAVGVSLRNFASDGGKRRSSAAARKWSFGRKCCCTGKKSVEVKDAATSDSEHGAAKRDAYNCKSKQSSRSCSIASEILEINQQKSFPSPDPAPRQQRISASGRAFVDGFSFPVLNNAGKPALKAIITKPIMNPLEEPARDSLEVFQPVREAVRFNPGSPPARVDDDAVSDASSDLFEIESFSTQTTSYPMYRRRDSLDEAPAFNARRFQCARRSVDEPPTPSVAGTECYAPSEVSIDWSVTTAEGFDRASVSNFSVSASEIGRAAFLRERMQEEGGGRKKGNGLLLMSCRQEKAVSVGPQPVKCEGAAHVGGRPPRAGKPPLASDHSARLSVAFAA